MLGRTVMTTSLDGEEDPTYPFRKVAEPLREADIVFINLENSIVTDCPRIYEGLQLCSVPEMVRELTYAGVDVVTLANNHIRYSAEAAVDETREVLEENGILVTGLGNLTLKTVNGIKFGFLGLDFETKFPVEEDYRLIRESRSKADVLIVGVHWGGQYTEKPTYLQRKWARQLVKEGADVVAGHGPHVVLDEDYVDSKPVFYSLGNFVFDQTWSRETQEGLVIRLIYKSNKLIAFEKIPTRIDAQLQPEFTNED
jgi:poly-gamma-glutamate capsule biosynthesis protein CapA/YwtB (metallophosphatase superfamily)